jgi:hypothetical protein
VTKLPNCLMTTGTFKFSFITNINPLCSLSIAQTNMRRPVEQDLRYSYGKEFQIQGRPGMLPFRGWTDTMYCASQNIFQTSSFSELLVISFVPVSESVITKL